MLFKIAARVKQYKDRVLLHLPSACPVKDLLVLVCQCGPCPVPHDPPRLAHEIVPPTQPIHYDPSFTPSAGERGAIA